jgi:hypothetical protein
VGWDSTFQTMFCIEVKSFQRISIGTAIQEMHICHFPKRVIRFYYKATKEILK